MLFRLLEDRLFGIDTKLLHPTMVDSAWPNLRNNLSPESEEALYKAISKEVNIDQCLLDLRPYVDSEPAVDAQSTRAYPKW